MEKTRFISLLFILSFILFLGCKKVPDNVIEPRKMEDILVDVHTAEGLMESESEYNSEEKKRQVMNGVYRKYNIKKSDFDSSLVWYGANLEIYLKIYDKVIARLEKKKEWMKVLIEEDDQRLLTQAGDTVDIWQKERQFTFRHHQMLNIVAFDIPVDANFKKKDHFTLKARLNLLPDSSQHMPLYAVLGVVYMNDSVKTDSRFIVNNGWVEMKLQTDTLSAFKGVFGSFSLPYYPDKTYGTVYLDSISLIRTHSDVPPDSIPTTEKDTKKGML